MPSCPYYCPPFCLQTHADGILTKSVTTNPLEVLNEFIEEEAAKEEVTLDHHNNGSNGSNTQLSQNVSTTAKGSKVITPDVSRFDTTITNCNYKRLSKFLLV